MGCIQVTMQISSWCLPKGEPHRKVAMESRFSDQQSPGTTPRCLHLPNQCETRTRVRSILSCSLEGTLFRELYADATSMKYDELNSGMHGLLVK